MSVELDASLWKSASKIGVVFLLFFSFFINLFMKTLIKSIMYCQTVPLDRLLMYIVKILFQASLPSFLTWISKYFVLGQCKWKLLVQLSIYVIGRRSVVGELKVMGGSCWATCKCNILCSLSCIEIKLFMEKTS